MGTPDYRALAAQCRALIWSASTRQVADVLRDMAAEYEQKAAAHERRQSH